jgi:hypothetical protein
MTYVANGIEKIKGSTEKGVRVKKLNSTVIL